MCDIYSRAYLTLAATRSNGSNEGCYASPRHSFDKAFTFLNTDDTRYEMYVRDSKDPSTIPHINDFEMQWRSDARFPLLQRAWAFQERILSPRVVHFGPNELLWECIELKTCQCSNWPGYDVPHESVFFELPSMTMTSMPLSFAGSKIPAPINWKWRTIIEHYTSKSLTHQSDIFPALQGVAKSMQQDRTYYAGLWNDETLLSNLLWRVRHQSDRPGYQEYHARCRRSAIDQRPPHNIQQGPRPAVWRAPTWSWASVTRPVIFDIQHSGTAERLAAVIDIDTVPVDPNPLGQLISGHLLLRGRCAKAQLAANRVHPLSDPDCEDHSIQLFIGTCYNSEVYIRHADKRSDLLSVSSPVEDRHSTATTDLAVTSTLEQTLSHVAEAESSVSGNPGPATNHSIQQQSAPAATNDDFTKSHVREDLKRKISHSHVREDLKRKIPRLYKQEKRGKIIKAGFSTIFHPDYDIFLNNRTVLVMEIMRWNKHDKVNGSSKEMYSYLTFDCVDEANDFYERIGCFHTEQRIDKDFFLEKGEAITLHII
jgi:hypothetical protein